MRRLLDSPRSRGSRAALPPFGASGAPRIHAHLRNERRSRASAVRGDGARNNAWVNAGEQVGFTIVVSNAGLGVAKDVVVSDALPGGSGIDWSIAAQTSDKCSITGAVGSETLACTIATLAAGDSYTVQITSPTSAATADLLLTNQAFVTTSNDGSDDSTATVDVLAPSINILKTADNASVNACEQVGFTIVVSNAGLGVAKDVVVSDALPGCSGIDWSIAAQTIPVQSDCQYRYRKRYIYPLKINLLKITLTLRAKNNTGRIAK